MDDFLVKVGHILKRYPREEYQLRYLELEDQWIAGNMKGCFKALNFPEKELSKLAASMVALEGQKLQQLAIKDVVVDASKREVMLILELPGYRCSEMTRSRFADGRLFSTLYALIVQRVAAAIGNGVQLGSGLVEFSFYSPEMGDVCIDPYARAAGVSPLTFTTTGEQKYTRKAQLTTKMGRIDKLIRGKMRFQSSDLRRNLVVLKQQLEAIPPSKTPTQVEALTIVLGGLTALGFSPDAFEFVKVHKSDVLFPEAFKKQFGEHIQCLAVELGEEIYRLIEILICLAVGNTKTTDTHLNNILYDLNNGWNSYFDTFLQLFEVESVQSSLIAVAYVDPTLKPYIVPFLDLVHGKGVNVADALAMCQGHGEEPAILVAFSNLKGTAVEKFVEFFRNMFNDPAKTSAFEHYSSALDASEDLVGTLRRTRNKSRKSYGLMVALPVLRIAHTMARTEPQLFLKSIRMAGYEKFHQSVHQQDAHVAQLITPAVERVLKGFMQEHKSK